MFGKRLLLRRFFRTFPSFFLRNEKMRTNFHFTRYHQGHAVEQVNIPDVPSLYQLLQQQFGLGVNDVKHGFTEAELAAVMAAFDTHPEAGK